MTDFAEDIERFLASFTPQEIAVMRHAFHAILEGEPTTIDDLPLGLPRSSADEAVQRLLDRGTLVLEDGWLLPGCDCRSLGPQVLKNVTGPVEVVEVRPAEASRRRSNLTRRTGHHG